MKRYLFEYRYEGDTYGFEVPADSIEEARARVKAMAWGRYEGEIAMSGVVPAGGLILRIWNWMRGGRHAD